MRAVPPRWWPSRWACAALATAALALASVAVVAEAPVGYAGADTADGDEDDLIAVETIPAVAAFGVQFGFPAYRTAGASVSLRARFAGLALRLGGGPGGVSFGMQVRAYLPLPVPLPTFLSVGADLYGGRLAPHAALGLHLPVAQRWRLDVEGGVAWTPLLDELRAAPYLGVGASYAVPLGLTPTEAPTRTTTTTAPASGSRCIVGPPDADGLAAALAATVRRFVADGVAAYGSVYRDLRYRTRVVEVALDGDWATMVVAYEGTVVEIVTGREISAAGEAEVDFRWDGCRWVRAGLRY